MTTKHLTKDEQAAIKEALGCKDNMKCPHMKEVGGGFSGERYRCERCDDSYYLDYDEMQ